MRVRLSCPVLCAVLMLAQPAPAGPAAPFDDLFAPDTMRLDYYHSGGPAGEVFALDRAVHDGPWAGSRTQLLDDTNLGNYLFEVIDRRTNRVVDSRGFASIYGEWETTPDARSHHRTFHESLRFPWPKREVQVYRPEADCIMFTRNDVGFCRVCRRAIERVIDLHTK